MVSIANMKDVQNLFPNARVSFISPSTTGSLQYLNIRVTERLHRYRLLKRQWQDMQTTAQKNSSLPSKPESLLPTFNVQTSRHEHIVEQKVCTIKDYIIPIRKTPVRENNTKTSTEVGPLRTQIQQDLLQLRKIIKTRQKKRTDEDSSKTTTNNRSCPEVTLINTPPNDQNNDDTTTTTKPSSLLGKVKPLDCVQISGSRVRSAVFPRNNLTDSGVVTISNSSNICLQNSKRQQKIKQEIHSREFRICRCRINESSSFDPQIHGTSPIIKRPSNIQCKTIENTTSKSTQPSRLSTQSIMKNKQSNLLKAETSLSPPIHTSSDSDEETTCFYTYAASTSSTVPSSMKLNRKTSLLPILLTSSSCLGTHQQENPSNYQNLLRYEKLLTHLPKPLIPIHSRCHQDGYDILFAQLDHIRETMPNSNVYNSYKRVC